MSTMNRKKEERGGRGRAHPDLIRLISPTLSLSLLHIACPLRKRKRRRNKNKKDILKFVPRSLRRMRIMIHGRFQLDGWSFLFFRPRCHKKVSRASPSLPMHSFFFFFYFIRAGNRDSFITSFSLPLTGQKLKRLTLRRSRTPEVRNSPTLLLIFIKLHI